MHYFDPAIAGKYGLIEALLLQHIFYWCRKNEEKGVNLFEGRAWTFNSVKTLKEVFPYITAYKIRRALSRLEEEKLVMTGNHNRSGYDRTTWYAVTDLGKSLLQNEQMDFSEPANGKDGTGQIDFAKPENGEDETETSILRNRQMEVAEPENGSCENHKSKCWESTNGSCENHKPIPDNIHKEYTDKEGKERKGEKKEKPDASRPGSPAAIPYEQVKELYNRICVSYPACTVLSDARRKAIRARLRSGYTVEDFRMLFEKAESSAFLRGGNQRNWRANFDWLIQDGNMAKVLGGNYEDLTRRAPPGLPGTPVYRTGNPFMQLLMEEEGKAGRDGPDRDA